MLSWVFYDFLDQTLMHSWSKFGSRIVVGKLYCNHNPFELCMKNSLIKPSCWVLIKTWVSSHTSLQFCSILVNFLTCFCRATRQWRVDISFMCSEEKILYFQSSELSTGQKPWSHRCVGRCPCVPPPALLDLILLLLSCWCGYSDLWGAPIESWKDTNFKTETCLAQTCDNHPGGLWGWKETAGFERSCNH